MGRNFDDYPRFQPFRSWANTYAQDCKSLTKILNRLMYMLCMSQYVCKNLMHSSKLPISGATLALAKFSGPITLKRKYSKVRHQKERQSLIQRVPAIHTFKALYVHNVCFKKKTWTNYSTVSLLWFVQAFLKQTLLQIGWFSVGICKYKTGYKSHDLL